MGLPGGGAGRSRRGLRVSGWSRNSARSRSARRTCASAAGSAAVAPAVPRAAASGCAIDCRPHLGRALGCAARSSSASSTSRCATRRSPRQARRALRRRAPGRGDEPREHAVESQSAPGPDASVRRAARSRLEQRAHDQGREIARGRQSGRTPRPPRKGSARGVGRVPDGSGTSAGEDALGDVEVLGRRARRAAGRAPPSAAPREPSASGAWPSPANAFVWYCPPTYCCAAWIPKRW